MLFRRDERPYTSDDELRGDAHRSTKGGLFGFLKGGPGAEDKELIVGIEIDKKAKAYKLEDLRTTGELTDTIGGTEITLKFEQETDNLTAFDSSGNAIDHLILYWFVWKSIHPESQVHE